MANTTMTKMAKTMGKMGAATLAVLNYPPYHQMFSPDTIQIGSHKSVA